MSAEFPLIIIIIDYLLGMIMWTLVGRFGLSIFMHETSDFFLYESVCEIHKSYHSTVQTCHACLSD